MSDNADDVKARISRAVVAAMRRERETAALSFTALIESARGVRRPPTNRSRALAPRWSKSARTALDALGKGTPKQEAPPSSDELSASTRTQLAEVYRRNAPDVADAGADEDQLDDPAYLATHWPWKTEAQWQAEIENEGAASARPD